MILAVSLNPCIDKIFYIDDFKKGRLYRADNIVMSAGGKGINAARVASIMGSKVCVIGFAAGQAGKWILQNISKYGIETEFVFVPGETRTNINIIDIKDNNETEILEMGPDIDNKDLARLISVYEEKLKYADLVMLLGGIPPGVDNNIYYKMIMKANHAKVKVILDTSGEALKKAVAAEPYIIKPNLRELKELTKIKIQNKEDIIKAAKIILKKGVENVIVSMGEKGAYFINKEMVIFKKPVSINPVNTIGCGDSMVGGLAFGIEKKYSLDESYDYAAACAISNALSEKVGFIDKKQVIEYKMRICTEHILNY